MNETTEQTKTKSNGTKPKAMSFRDEKVKPASEYDVTTDVILTDDDLVFAALNKAKEWGYNTSKFEPCLHENGKIVYEGKNGRVIKFGVMP